jgi:hypothetical protein
VTVHRVNFLITKPTGHTNFSNLFWEWNSTCFGQFLCPSSGVFYCTHINGICHTSFLTACGQDQDGTEFYPDPLLYVQWKTPDDGQRNCPKHVEFYCKNKFEKLVHLVGFIISKLCYYFASCVTLNLSSKTLNSKLKLDPEYPNGRAKLLVGNNQCLNSAWNLEFVYIVRYCTRTESSITAGNLYSKIVDSNMTTERSILLCCEYWSGKAWYSETPHMKGI